ncbi:MAG TPA: hypothetical protein VLF79_01765 [Candidatus Saccharimonadales bacterium]|nr:hypothetical protein [Candidatus Saccharimonadales bacterium]
MAMINQKRDFINSDEGKAIKQALQVLADDSSYNTRSSYHPNVVLYADNQIDFVDRHLEYLKVHPQLDAWKYIANIKLMTRIR